MLTIRYESTFKKDYKRIVRRGYDVRLLENVITMLAEQEQLPQRFRDHALSGDYSGFRECHITPDWLLIYSISKQELVLYLTRTGTHSDLFDK
ncbi:MAG: type II toxin-antitoxin system YafQ family toxin [Clostridia bacterium]|nr:type II toxin-antitoxin system YafQ family toxin [Clostridia bacterium]